MIFSLGHGIFLIMISFIEIELNINIKTNIKLNQIYKGKICVFPQRIERRLLVYEIELLNTLYLIII